MGIIKILARAESLCQPGQSEETLSERGGKSLKWIHQKGVAGDKMCFPSSSIYRPPAQMGPKAVVGNWGTKGREKPQ